MCVVVVVMVIMKCVKCDELLAWWLGTVMMVISLLSLLVGRCGDDLTMVVMT